MHGQRPDSTRPQPKRVQSTRLIGVYDAPTGVPLSGVRVLDTFSGTSAMTTSTGTVGLGFLTFRGGAAVVELGKLGYQAKQIIVVGSDTTSITEIMEPFVELGPVVTTENYAIDRDAGRWGGFERRCRSKSVTCIRNDALEKRPAANLADFLIHAPRVTIGSCGGGGRIVGNAAVRSRCDRRRFRRPIANRRFSSTASSGIRESARQRISRRTRLHWRPTPPAM
jgi:hypothetical protein